MKSVHEFLVMGGYAMYVWPAYGIAAVVLIVNAWLPGRQLRRLLKQLKHREQQP
ncbi:MAG TPA: heme exporter protein CcmD [Gammaproteobacteria bacterium]|nr:heme exporter protein CcmD [Gammaproteobacteria bacterium]